MNFPSFIIPLLALLFVAATVGFLIAWYRANKEKKLLEAKLTRENKKQQTLQKEFKQLNDYTNSLQSDKVKLASMNDELYTDLTRQKIKFANSGDELAQHKLTIRKLAEDLEETTIHNGLLLKNVNGLRQELEITKKQKEGLAAKDTTSSKELSELQTFLEEARQKQAQQNKEINNFRTQQLAFQQKVNSLSTGNNELAEEKQKLEEEINTIKTQLSQLANEYDTLSTQYKSSLEDLAKMDKTVLFRLEQTITDLNEQLSAKDVAAQEQNNIIAGKRKLEHELELLKEENRNWKVQFYEITGTIDSYKNKNQSLHKVIQELQEEVRILSLQVSADQAPNNEKALNAQMKLRNALGKRIKNALANEKDDLKKINGLNNFVEKRLNRLGIFTYEQISQLDDELINTMSTALQFLPDRIIEDDWVGQASDLLKVKLNDPDDFLNKTPKGKKQKARNPNDLKIIEGIGPKIEQLLKDAGIESWAMLAQTKVEVLRNILEEAGSRYKMHNPASWPEQAKLAHQGKWEALIQLQDKLMGGRR